MDGMNRPQDESWCGLVWLFPAAEIDEQSTDVDWSDLLSAQRDSGWGDRWRDHCCGSGFTNPWLHNESKPGSKYLSNRSLWWNERNLAELALDKEIALQTILSFACKASTVVGFDEAYTMALSIGNCTSCVTRISWLKERNASGKIFDCVCPYGILKGYCILYNPQCLCPRLYVKDTFLNATNVLVKGTSTGVQSAHHKDDTWKINFFLSCVRNWKQQSHLPKLIKSV